jgi:hypothetical protein
LTKINQKEIKLFNFLKIILKHISHQMLYFNHFMIILENLIRFLLSTLNMKT